MKPIKPLSADSAPNLLSAKRANEIITTTNALSVIRVVPAEYGKVVIGDDGIVIDLAGLDAAVQKLIDRARTYQFNMGCTGTVKFMS